MLQLHKNVGDSVFKDIMCWRQALKSNKAHYINCFINNDLPKVFSQKALSDHAHLNDLTNSFFEEHLGEIASVLKYIFH